MQFSEKIRILRDAQQSFRFFLAINDVPVAYIVNVLRPSYTIGTQEYKLLNYYFNHPTEIKWNPISFSIREVFSRDVDNSIAGLFIKKLREAAYDTPDEIDPNNFKDLAKSDLINSLGRVKIQMLNPEGEKYEEWTLHGAFINDVKFSQLDYSQDALTNVDVSLTYDWATLEFFYLKK